MCSVWTMGHRSLRTSLARPGGKRAFQRAVPTDPTHVLLAPAGAPRIARHQDLTTTSQYMHLSPAAIDSAIRLLERASPAEAGHYKEAEGSRSRSFKPKA
jgi:hypothetical protein